MTRITVFANDVRALAERGINATTSASRRRVAIMIRSIANRDGAKISLRPRQVPQLLDSLGAL